MFINILGSTGIIGVKSLDILKKYYPNIKIDLLFANENHSKILEQSKIYKPKAICLKNKFSLDKIKDDIDHNIKIIYFDDLKSYLKSTNTFASILSVSGYDSINYLEEIFINTTNLGLVNKECIVSCGHLFNELISINKVNLFPLDSEHYSIYNLISNNNDQLITNYNKIYLTASGGPFLNYDNKDLKDVTFDAAISHPKWKMGYKNSIDSATLVNKCLEMIEASYLFNLDIKNLDIIIHPEALAHSIIEYKNHTSVINHFFTDMFIPIFNFFNFIYEQKIDYKKKYRFEKKQSLNFFEVDSIKYPIYEIFKSIINPKPIDFIKFNLANQLAVDMFRVNKIKFTDIAIIIEKSLTYELNLPINSIADIINFKNKFNTILLNQNEIS